MKSRLLSYILAALLAAGPVQAQSQLLLGAGKPSAAAPPSTCADGSNLDIDWTAADGLGSFGVACVNGTTGIAVSTLGTFSGAAAASAGGLALTGGFFQFTNVSWLAQGTGTLYSALSLTTATGTRVFFSVSDGTTNNQVVIRTLSSTLRALLQIGGVAVTLPNSALATATATPYKIAFSYTTGSQILCVNGGNDATDTQVENITGLNAANVGASPTGASTTLGTITRTKFFATALASTAACNALTT